MNSYSQQNFRLLCLLSSYYFMDHQAYSSFLTCLDPTFYHDNGSSHLDYIWSWISCPGLFSHIITYLVKKIPSLVLLLTYYFSNMNITLVTLTFLNLLNLSLSTSFWIDFYLGFLLLPDYIIPTYITNLSAFKFFLHSVPNGLNGILYDLMNIYPCCWALISILLC